MKQYADKAIENALPLALGGVAILLGIYWIVKNALGGAIKGAGGLLSGDNAITKSATDFDGNKVTAYENRGVPGTLGAATNAVTGGLLASAGGKLGSLIYDWTHKTPTTGITYYSVIFPDGARHAVDAGHIDSQGYFLRNGVRYRMAVDQANNRVAVRV